MRSFCNAALLAFVHGAAASHLQAAEWTRTAIPLPESIWSVEAVDVNADGKSDIIAMGETKVFGLIAPDWKPQILADTIEPKLLYCVAFDADADGDSDIALGRYRVPWVEHRAAIKAGKSSSEPKSPDFSLAWIENTGSAAKPWPIHVIDKQLNGIHGLWVGDVNGDGKKDLLADSIMGPDFPNSLLWFETPNTSNGNFKRHVISRDGADGRPHYIDFADINGDKKGDVLLGDSKGGTFTWWQNATWQKTGIAHEPGATNIRAADVNGDGKIDIVGSCGHGKGVFWFEGPKWTKHNIDPELASPHALTIGDFDKDGDVDVAAATVGPEVVKYYENGGNGEFDAQTIDSGNKQQAYDLKSADVDGDGGLDLILAGRESRNAVWYRMRK